MENNDKRLKTNYVYQKQQKYCFEEIFGNISSDDMKYKKISIERNYENFSDYIKNALKAAKEKNSVTTKYEIVDTACEVKLNKWVKLRVTSKIINGSIANIGEAELNTLLNFAKNTPIEEVSVKKIAADGVIADLISDGNFFYLPGDENTNILINDDENIQFEKERYYPEHIIYKNKEIPCAESRVNIPNFDIEHPECIDLLHPQIIFIAEKNNDKHSKNEITIQLFDNPNADISPFEYFFSDTATQVYFNNDKNNTYIIKHKMKEVGRIKVEAKDKRFKPQRNGNIYLSTDLNQLRKQKDAIACLKNRPSKFHKPLLDLADKKRNVPHLEAFPDNDLKPTWKVLTANTEGTKEQREFVIKSLQTPDFAILQGPPGSGKTTAILELIYQAAKQNKKILLCASTHVAIDNVLEKILQHPNKEELLKVINPVRIGDENNVYSDCVKQFVYSNIKEGTNDTYNNIMLNSFNLVCGTTIGVLQFPLINEAFQNAQNTFIEPLFDYLIIDEASKTTFSEFLVPAVLCKRWILVGDIQQLSPYIDDEDLIPNLKECEALDSKGKREAISFLIEYRDKNKRNKLDNKCFVLSKESIEYIDSHLPVNLNSKNNLIAITNGKLANILSITPSEIKKNNPVSTVLNAKNNIILVEEGAEKLVIPLLNSEYGLFIKDRKIQECDDKDTLSIVYRNNANTNFNLVDYNKFYEVYSKKIESEIIWRLIRTYELAAGQKLQTKYKEYINKVEECFNENEKQSFRKTIDMLSNIAIPSIIKMLQVGIDPSNQYKTRLTDGFEPDEKEARYTLLEYQHRMHKDISEFPRTHIYNCTALKDCKTWKSSIQYCNDNGGLEIRDIHRNEEVKNSVNTDEVDAIMTELDLFMNFIKNNKDKYQKPVKIAILSFYNAQVGELRRRLKKKFNSINNYNYSNELVSISLNTVDRFQGQEADVVYLSMVQNNRTGFLDSINRLNVAITRAKIKLIIFGDKKYFSTLADDTAPTLKALFQ